MSLDALLAANAAYYAAFTGGDAKAMSLIWSSRHPIVCAHPGWPLLEGREQVLESFRAILSGDDATRLRMADPRAMQGAGLGCVICTETVAGGELLATNVFVLEDDGWRMVHHHAGAVSVRTRPPAPSTDGGWKN